MEVEEIRGVQSSGSVQKLVAKRLIEEKGRVDGPGRAILYGTTEYFMDYFGLKSLVSTRKGAAFAFIGLLIQVFDTTKP